MVEESIVFGPEVSDRELDREVGKIERAMSDVDTTVGVDGDAGGLGMPDVDGEGGDDTLGNIESGIGGMTQQLRSKLPAAVPAVAAGAAAALPIALAGGVGMGMLNAMQSSSARLQTSTSLLRQAWDNVWRPIGDDMDQLFVRDVVEDVVDATRDFEETWRNESRWKAIVDLEDDLKLDVAADFMYAPARTIIREALGHAREEINAELTPESVVGAIGWPELEAPAVVTAIGWPALDATEIMRVIGWPDLDDEWSGWPDVEGGWGGWPAVGEEWPGWPAVTDDWPGWPGIRTLWPGWPDIPGLWPGWPTIGTPSWPSASAILDHFPTVTRSDLVDAVTGGGGGNGGDNGDDGGGWLPGGIDTSGVRDGGVSGLRNAVMQSGGSTGRSGASVTPSDLERAVERGARAAGGNGGGNGGGDLSRLERKLDDVAREERKTRQALESLEIKTDRETLARATSKGRQDVFDSDPLM